ncbi:MAG: hypothetical protein EKK54_06325 [Neisseriaceae bacterium]|nr:MAG: hypothetical protein EKK54_06325 [Neisseriaceae bacterium]
MSQYIVAAINAYQKQLASLNSAVENESLTKIEADSKKNEINYILDTLESVLKSAGNSIILNEILAQIEKNNDLNNENKNYLISVIKSSRQLDKPNFFYNEILVQKVREKIPDGSKFTLEQIINELIIIYADLQKYYEQYMDVFRFTTNIQNAFNSKISGLKEILKHSNRGSLTRELSQSIVDARLEPIVFNLITAKLKREQYDGFKAIDKSGLYIEIYSFPPEFSELEIEYIQKIKEFYSDDSPIKFDNQTLFNDFTLTEIASEKQTQSLNNDTNKQLPSVKNDELLNPEILKQNSTPDEIKIKLEALSKLIESLISSNKESVLSNQKILETINSLGNDEEHYLKKLTDELSTHLSNILQQLESNKSEFNQLLSEYSSKVSASSNNDLVNTISELNNKLTSINKTSENLNNVTSFLTDLKANITDAFQSSVTNLTDLVQNAVQKNINSDIISKSVLDMISFSNKSATDKIEKVSDSIKLNLSEAVTEYNKNAEVLKNEIGDLGRSMVESYTTNVDKVNKAITDFKTELNKKQQAIDVNEFKNVLTAVKNDVANEKNELVNSNDELKKYINDKFLTRLADLQKTINTNSGFLDTNNRNNTHRKGYFWSVVTTVFSVLIFLSMLTLIYTIKSNANDANDSIEYHRILNKLNSIDQKNQSAIKQVLEIK